MKALCWFGTKDVRIEEVPEPKILNDQDIIVKVSKTAICGSDLHLYHGFIPTMERGDILGHEFMGMVVEVGKAVKNLQLGDKVVIPFAIACGRCHFCNNQLYSACDNSNPNRAIASEAYGHSGAGLFGYSHMLGGYAGGQAEFVRVPFADVGAFKVPEEIPDEKVLFLSDIFPTGYMAAENCGIKRGDTIAVWGCGPVGQFCIRSAYLLGAEQVIAIDDNTERLDLAKRYSGALTLNFSEVNVYEALKEMTGGMGPHACIEAVGMEAHGTSVDAIIDSVKAKLYLASDKVHALRQAIYCCRKGGVVSIPGVYGGFLDKFPLGSAFAKGLTFKMGQTHVHRYMKTLMDLVARGDIDPSFIISHRLPLSEAPSAYKTFAERSDKCTKVVLTP